MKINTKTLFFILFVFLSFVVNAQSNSNKTDSLLSKPSKKVEIKELDTKESIEYLGNNLFFQIRKRLNLTDEKEEKAHQKKKQRFRLNIGGLKIEN